MAKRAVAPRSLASLRRDLEEIDRAIVLLVAARVESACTAIRFRVENGEGVSHPVQEARVIARAREWAGELGVSPIAVETIFRAIVRAGKERFAATVMPATATSLRSRARAPGRAHNPRPAAGRHSPHVTLSA